MAAAQGQQQRYRLPRLPHLRPLQGARKRCHSRRAQAGGQRSEDYFITKSLIFGALIEAIDLSQLSKLDAESALGRNSRYRQRDHFDQNVVMSISEQEELLDDICNDVLGYGPLEPLLSREDIAISW